MLTNCVCFCKEALPGVLGNREKRAFISGEQEQRPNFEGTGEQRQYWGTGNIRKFSIFGHTCDIILDANREIWALKSYFVF